MTKFKLLLKLKKGPQKCLKTIRSYLMDKPDKNKNFEESDHGARRKIKVHKKGDEIGPREDLANTSSEEGFIPLAARDSKWVDLAFYNPNFQNQQEDEDLDEEELQVVDIEGNLKAPMLILFPGLSENEESSSIIANNLGSTTDVTKMLVGQKPDFSRMRSSKKLLPTENRLTSVPEMPQEETESPGGSVLSYLPIESSIPGSDELNEVHESEDDGPVRATHTKRRKKRSMVKIVTYDSSSSMVNTLRQRPPSKPRLKGNVTKLKRSGELGFQSSSNGSLGDEDTN